MHITLSRENEYVQITFFENVIDAHWNDFSSVEAALEYFKKHLKKNGNEYGYVIKKYELFKIDLEGNSELIKGYEEGIRRMKEKIAQKRADPKKYIDYSIEEMEIGIKENEEAIKKLKR